jgi:hypothetical protein
MAASATPGKNIYRRRIVEMIADDYRDNYGLMLGLAEEKGVISMLRLPGSLARVVFPGGLYDLKGTILDRDTDFSPETILINAARRVDEERRLAAQPPAGSTIPSVIQDAWRYTWPLDTKRVLSGDVHAILDEPPPADHDHGGQVTPGVPLGQKRHRRRFTHRRHHPGPRRRIPPSRVASATQSNGSDSQALAGVTPRNSFSRIVGGGMIGGPGNPSRRDPL